MNPYQPPNQPPYQPPYQQPNQTPYQNSYPPMYPPQPYPVARQVVYYVPQKSAGVAVILELLPGMFIQTFGIGHLYAGNVGVGLLFMFGYWFVLFINFLLCFIFIGFITLPICWIFTLIISTISAASSVTNQQRRY